jgi:hypothetical protein
MSAKNVVADNGVWNLCNLSKNEFEIKIDNKHLNQLQKVIEKGNSH